MKQQLTRELINREALRQTVDETVKLMILLFSEEFKIPQEQIEVCLSTRIAGLNRRTPEKAEGQITEQTNETNKKDRTTLKTKV